MSSETKPRKPRSSTKKSTSELETKSTPPPAPKPRPAASGPTHGTLPAGMTPPPKPKEAPKPSTSTSSDEVAPAYATTSSTGYTGNKYFATRARLAYHPPDKQYKGESVTTQTSTSRPSSESQYTYQETTSSQQKQKSSSSWKAKGAQAAEEYTSEMSPKSETRPTPPPAPKPRPAEVRSTPPPQAQKSKPSSVSSGEVAPAYATLSSTGYTGNRYYATRARLSYHPPDKQYKGEAQAATVQVAEKPKPKRGTLPAGFKP